MPVSVTEGLVLLTEAVQKCMNHSKSLTNHSFNQFLDVLYTFTGNVIKVLTYLYKNVKHS